MDVSYPHLPSPENEAEGKIVYVRPVAVSELPDEVRAQAEGLDHIYSVNGTDGTRLALVANRRLAFELAREHDFSPVNVH